MGENALAKLLGGTHCALHVSVFGLLSEEADVAFLKSHLFLASTFVSSARHLEGETHGVLLVGLHRHVLDASIKATVTIFKFTYLGLLPS